MTAEKTGQTKEREERSAGWECCFPQGCAGMMAECGCGCGALMQEMMQGECCQPEEK